MAQQTVFIDLGFEMFDYSIVVVITARDVAVEHRDRRLGRAGYRIDRVRIGVARHDVDFGNLHAIGEVVVNLLDRADAVFLDVRRMPVNAATRVDRATSYEKVA